jgi:uncharacterized protein involved in response to NO
MPIHSADAPRQFVLFNEGFRPLFLFCGIHAVLSMALWIAMLAGVLELPSLFDSLAWHQHEMVFGFIGAAIGGFLMAAVPHWTGRAPVRGPLLHLLVGAWLAGRLAVAFSEIIGALPAVVLDLSFLLILSGVVAREVLASGNRRNVKITILLLLLAVANGFFHAEFAGLTDDTAGPSMVVALFVIAVLVAVIAGRIIPNFTRNWLAQRGETKLPASWPRLDAAAIALLVLTGLAFAFMPESPFSGALALLAAAAHGARLAGWRGLATLSEPILWVLHLGYAWLVIGLALLGLSILTDLTSGGAALHAIGAGAMGTTVLAVMTRASLGHTGRELRVSAMIMAAYVLVSLSAILRIVAPALGEAVMTAYTLAGLSWIGAYGLFLVVYLPILIRPRVAA